VPERFGALLLPPLPPSTTLIFSSVAQIRYGSLSITGETVTLKWAADDNSFTLSGTYGLGY
jgi:hypothetical protein